MLNNNGYLCNYLYINTIIFTFAASFLDQVVPGAFGYLPRTTEKVMNDKKTTALL